MPFPATKAEMLEDGYTFAAMKTCPCGASMELWNTPRGATMPMNPMPQDNSPAISHWTNCEKAAQFRRKPLKKENAMREHPEQTESFRMEESQTADETSCPTMGSLGIHTENYYDRSRAEGGCCQTCGARPPTPEEPRD